MGTKMAPIYATLVLGYLELKLYLNVQTNFGLHNFLSFKKYYFQYLDDVILINDRNGFNICYINNLLNQLCKDLEFNLESTGESMNFLDIKIIKINNKLETDIFYKPTDTKQYLNFRSCHPRHVKRALPYNLARRICTIVSNDEVKVKRLEELSDSLVRCNYPKNLINDSINKALSYSREMLLNPKDATSDEISSYI